MMTPEGMVKARGELAVAYGKLASTMAACRYCKTAQRRGKRGCKEHVSRSRLIYVTSPVSETYWAS